MKKLKTGDIETKVNRLLFKYRITPHTSTGVSPSKLMLKREIRTPFHLIQPGSQITPRAEAKTKTRKFKVGDMVWLRNFGKGDKWVPGTVSAIRGNVNYDVSLTNKEETVHRHVDQLKERVGEVIESNDLDLELPQEPSEASMTPTTNANPILRRSTRVSRKPAWCKDFVSK